LLQIDPSISLIDTEALDIQRVVAAYLVIGEETALIDMGYRSSAETVARDLTAAGIGPEDLDYLLPTHVHLDHAGSCGTLAEKFPNATVRVHPIGEPHICDPSRLVKGTRELFGDALMAEYGLPDPVDTGRVKSISDSEEINLGRGIVLRSIWTPGHASHHLSYVLEEGRIVFTGDAVGVHYPDFPVLVPTTPPTSFNLEQAITSLDRIRALTPAQLMTPHFGIIKDAMHWMGDNVEILQLWNNEIGRMVADGASSENIAIVLTKRLCERANLSLSDVPRHLRTLVKISVQGYLQYFKWKAKAA
jgi:glyoxylase-like metal-dependent hydrolase (beta-lactamase superfamily II)